MEENILNSGSFSLRKIPVNQKDSLTNQNNCIKDKIKILELSNYIDEWENTLLFSEKGFFSLKGKEAENKTKEYSSELEDFINTQIAQMHFESNEAKQIAYNIKKDKRAAIEKQMQLYENEQMQQWETSVYENALKSAIKRAVLYKNNDSIISTSFKNGLTVLSLMEEKEHWEKKTYNSRKKMFESEFYYSLITEFIKDKDVHAALYFEKYKEKLSDKQYEELEESIKYLKINVTAYNYAAELWSYDLEDSENEKEINSIKEKEIQSAVKKFISDFKISKKISEEKEKKAKNESNWNTIIEKVKSEPDKAILYIDYTLSAENQKLKKDYIQNIIKNGCIKTDKTKFINIFEQIYNDFEEFKEFDISDFHRYLSETDYKIIENRQKQSEDEYNLFVSDYEYIKNELTNARITTENGIYGFIKYLFSAIELYKTKNEKDPDTEARDKLIKSTLEKYKNLYKGEK